MPVYAASRRVLLAPPKVRGYLDRALSLSPIQLAAFDEATGSVAFDRTANGRNGAYKSSSAPTKGQTGPFSGTLAPLLAGSDYINMYGSSLAGAFNGDQCTFAVMASVTSAAWTDGSQHNVLTYRVDANNTFDLFKSTTNNQLRFSSQAAGAGQKNINVTRTDTGWMFLVIRRDLANTASHLYVNAVAQGLDANAAGTFTGSLVSTTTCAGALNTSALFGWKGGLYGLAVYASALSPGDIAYLYGGPGQVIWDGDSLTFGSTNSYPNQVVTTLSGLKVAVSGRTIAQMITDAPTKVDIHYRPYIPRNVVSFWGGTNDLGQGDSATTTFNRLLSYVSARRAVGWQVYVKTVTKRGDAPFTAGMETERQSYNTQVINGAAANGYTVLDVASDALLQDTSNTTYYGADKEHLTTTGYGVVAAYDTAVLG